MKHCCEGAVQHWCFRAQCANFADTFGTALCMKQIVYSGCDLASMVVKVPWRTGEWMHIVLDEYSVLDEYCSVDGIVSDG